MTYDDRNRLGSTMAWRHLPTGRVGCTLDKVCKITFGSSMKNGNSLVDAAPRKTHVRKGTSARSG